MSRLLKCYSQNMQKAGCSQCWSVTTFLFTNSVHVCLRGNEQMNVGRKAKGLKTLGCTQEKSGCRLLRLGIKIDAAWPAQGPWDCIFPAAYEE